MFLASGLVVNLIEDGGDESIDGDGIRERRSGFCTFDDAYDIALTSAEVIIGDEVRLCADGLGAVAAVVELGGIERADYQKTPTSQGRILDGVNGASYDLGESHGENLYGGKDWFIDESLDEHADGRGIVVDEMLCTEAISADKDFLVEGGAEDVNRDKGSTSGGIVVAEGLAQ